LLPRNELEHKISEVFAEVLGINKDNIGINDKFFRLGGNSILAIKLVSKLNDIFAVNLKASDIFVNQRIVDLISCMFRTKSAEQIIIKLNSAIDKPVMFMIHPGSSGCEVYKSIADRFVDRYSCYGVDSYNLYSEVKIESLNSLAKYYLNEINKIMVATNQKEYIFFGWSLGGQIALEIAAILEKSGVTNIKIYLLDSIVADSTIKKLRQQYIGLIQDKIITKLKEKGYDDFYMTKVITNIEAENKLANGKISSNLSYSQIILFKALLLDNFPELANYILKLEDNNLKSIIKNDNQLIVINLQCTHLSILEKEDEIYSNIARFV